MAKSRILSSTQAPAGSTALEDVFILYVFGKLVNYKKEVQPHLRRAAQIQKIFCIFVTRKDYFLPPGTTDFPFPSAFHFHRTQNPMPEDPCVNNSYCIASDNRTEETDAVPKDHSDHSRSAS